MNTRCSNLKQTIPSHLGAAGRKLPAKGPCSSLAPATPFSNQLRTAQVPMARGSRNRLSLLWLPALAAFLVVLGGCTQQREALTVATTSYPPLPQLKEIKASDGSLKTALTVKLKKWVKQDDVLKFEGDVTPEECDVPDKGFLCLRTFGSPKDPARAGDPDYLANDDNLDWTIPGPVFMVRKADQTRAGDSISLRLTNGLAVPEIPDDECEPPYQDDTPPNCFHGDNTTNLHYHGFRVSPNPPQDWIFLKLRPCEDPTDCQDPEPPVYYGSFQFEIDPITEIQAEGTHWYHPHKHGSTALQVFNGMAGAFLIKGEFDAYLEGEIPGLKEQVLVVQQIDEKFRFPGGGAPPDRSFWVNGAKNPYIEMAPGEIQRWRFVGATQQASAHIVLRFEGIKVRQVAQDGVQFADQNYQDQPLDLSRPTAFLRRALFNRLPEPPPVSTRGEVDPLMQLAPGNRVDVLVEAPLLPGDYEVEYEELQALAPEVMLQLLQEIRSGDKKPLLVLRVRDEAPVDMNFPDRLPALPGYLEDISNPGPPTPVVFSMSKAKGGNPPPQFYIDGKQYEQDRIDHEVYLERDEAWHLQNTSDIAHPFHIHVNPFQIVSVNGVSLRKPWVWWDTISIPIEQTDEGVFEDEVAGTVLIYQRFLGFTGEYVLHCHILGHEDRGMMQNVRANPQ